MCVYAKGLVGVREVGFRGKLPHHLFIQSTEDGVSWEREAAVLGILEVKSCFSCYQHNPLSGEKKSNKQTSSTTLDLLSTWHVATPDMSHYQEHRSSPCPLLGGCCGASMSCSEDSEPRRRRRRLMELINRCFINDVRIPASCVLFIFNAPEEMLCSLVLLCVCF